MSMSWCYLLFFLEFFFLYSKTKTAKQKLPNKNFKEQTKTTPNQ